MMEPKPLLYLFRYSLFALWSFSVLSLVASCHSGVSIHPSRLTANTQQECTSALSGVYDTQIRVVSPFADTTLQLKATILDYDHGMEMILHDFPLSTLATALPDSLGELRTAIAVQSDKELTIDYQFRYNGDTDQLSLAFSPHDLPFTCQTADGQKRRLRLTFWCPSLWEIGALEDKIIGIKLYNYTLSLSAIALYEDERPLFTFDEWKSNDFYVVVVQFKE